MQSRSEIYGIDILVCRPVFMTPDIWYHGCQFTCFWVPTINNVTMLVRHTAHAKRYWNIPHTAWPCHHMTSTCFTPSLSVKGWRFRSDEDIKAMVMQWFQQQAREFFVEGIHWLVYQTRHVPQCPWKLFLMASTQSLRTIPWMGFIWTSLHIYTHIYLYIKKITSSCLKWGEER
jgi:hypothetical protein